MDDLLDSFNAEKEIFEVVSRVVKIHKEVEFVLRNFKSFNRKENISIVQ